MSEYSDILRDLFIDWIGGWILATQILESIGARVLETATAVAELARRRPRKTVGVPGNAKHFWGRGDATERAAGREHASGQLE